MAADTAPTGGAGQSARTSGAPEDETIEISVSTVFDVIDVLRLTPIYAMLNSAFEDEIADDFNPDKWIGYEREHAEKAMAAHRDLLRQASAALDGENARPPASARQGVPAELVSAALMDALSWMDPEIARKYRQDASYQAVAAALRDATAARGDTATWDEPPAATSGTPGAEGTHGV